MDSYGISFSPTASLDKSQKPTDPNTSVQEAIRTLALRIPKVTGAKGFAPDALMGGSGAQGTLGLDRLLQALFGAQMPTGQAPQAQPMGALTGGGTLTPRVTGLTDPQQVPDLIQSPEPSLPQEPARQETPFARTYGKPTTPGAYSDL